MRRRALIVLRDSRVATEALHAIANLAVDAELRKQLVDEDTIKTMMDVMTRFPSILSVQERVIYSLLIITDSDQ